jgi:flagellar motor switch protein FliG
MWDNLDNMNEAVLANYFKNEYPQTVAVVLSKIKPEHASKVWPLFPKTLRWK